ncbi:hypothetical protein BH23BAC1_BH23BAC1_46980 [soil metagenome]
MHRRNFLYLKNIYNQVLKELGNDEALNVKKAIGWWVCSLKA